MDTYICAYIPYTNGGGVSSKSKGMWKVLQRRKYRDSTGSTGGASKPDSQSQWQFPTASDIQDMTSRRHTEIWVKS